MSTPHGRALRARRGLARRLAASAAAALLALPGPGLAASAAGQSPTPAESPGARATVGLPKLFAEGSVTDVRGKIVRSTRGRPGPVRLEVAPAEGGAPLEVLVAADEVCDRLGLSLRTGEEVHLRGSLFAGKVPIFVASSVVVEGKAIAVRGDLPGRGPKAPGGAAAKKPSPADSH